MSNYPTTQTVASATVAYRSPAGTYEKIRKWFMEDTTIPLETSGAGMRLLAKPDGWEIRPERLAREWGIGRHKTERILAELARIGLIRPGGYIRDDAGNITGRRRSVLDASRFVVPPVPTPPETGAVGLTRPFTEFPQVAPTPPETGARSTSDHPQLPSDNTKDSRPASRSGDSRRSHDYGAMTVEDFTGDYGIDATAAPGLPQAIESMMRKGYAPDRISNYAARKVRGNA